MADEHSKKLMAFAIATANQEDRFTGNLMRVYLAPEMGLDALDWETIQDVGQLQAALGLEPGRVRIKLADRNLEESKAKPVGMKNSGQYDDEWVCLRPGQTGRGLHPGTRYQVQRSDYSGDIWLRDADGQVAWHCSYSCLALAVDALPLHLALKSKLSCEIVASLLAADPATASIPDTEGFPALHTALKSKLPIEYVNIVLNAYPKAAAVPDAKGFLALHHALNAQMYPADMVSNLLAAFPQAADTSLLGLTRLPAETTALLANMAIQATKSEVQATKSEVMSLRDEMQREREMHRDEMQSLRSEMAEIKGYLLALVQQNGSK